MENEIFDPMCIVAIVFLIGTIISMIIGNTVSMVICIIFGLLSTVIGAFKTK